MPDRRWFPGQDPIGKRVNINGVPREVVGVVPDVLQRSPAEPAVPMLFVPFAQRTIRSVKMVVRATGDPAALATAIRTEIRALDQDLAIADITPMTRLVARSMARPRFYTSLLSLFAAVALVLAATGVFGVMSYAVAQRSREISIRLALGALPGDVLRMIVGRALALSAAGVVVGLGAALVLGRFIQGQLFGVTLVDPVTLGSVALVLGASAALASFLPARRATKFDPAICEQRKEDAARPAAVQPGGVAAPPVTWSDFDLSGTLIDPEPTVRALMTPTMTRNRAMTESAREEITEAAEELGYHVVGLGTRSQGSTGSHALDNASA